MAVMSPETAQQIRGWADSLADATELQRALRSNRIVTVYIMPDPNIDSDNEATKVEVKRGTSLRRQLLDAAAVSITQYTQMIHDALEVSDD